MSIQDIIVYSSLLWIQIKMAFNKNDEIKCSKLQRLIPSGGHMVRFDLYMFYKSSQNEITRSSYLA